jgi:carotenoid 1,2-hydratase
VSGVAVIDDPRPAIGFVPDPTPRRFDLSVAAGGYAWWYLDAVADDGETTLTAIAFIGSVFSPRYARARRAAARDASGIAAERFAAINLAVVRKRGAKLWVMNEHAELARDAESLQIGSSRLRWAHDEAGEHLRLDLDERATRFFGRPGEPVRGSIRLYPAAIFAPRIALDRQRPVPRHRWYPVAPHARVELELDAPSLGELRFSGSGYHDVNEGDEPLEAGFRRWNWSRAELGPGRSAILYDVVARDGSGQVDPRGWMFMPERRAIEQLEVDALAPELALPPTRWRVARAMRSEAGHPPRLISTLEDTPFYSRNLIAARIAGHEVSAVHESLDCERFANRGVQFLLGFKTWSR